MLFGEILIDGVFLAALLAAMTCLAYLVYSTILEVHLLRSRRVRVRAGAWPGVVETLSSSVNSKSDHWRPGSGSPALPAGKR